MENKIEAKNLDLYYGEKHALKNVSLNIKTNKITAFIGPSGCGKSTFLKTLNRMVELVPIVRTTGVIEYRERNIFDKSYPVEELRTHVGMVFQKPNPFPKSIYENVTYGPKIHGIRDKKTLDEIVEKSLRGAAIWDELKDRLHDNAYGLSGGQQQRVFIARALVSDPELLILDEPTVGIDVKNVESFYEILEDLNKRLGITLILVTHDMGAVTEKVTHVACWNKHLHFHGNVEKFRELEDAEMSVLYGHHVHRLEHEHEHHGRI